MPNLKNKLIVAALAAVLGIAGSLIKPWEGKVNKTYLDPVGIATVCYGHTGSDVKLGRVRTDAECEALLQADMVEALAVVDRCTPNLPLNARAAFTSFAFNIGGQKYCASTLAKKANGGNLAQACADLSRWVYAGGQKLKGLENRRAAERAVCERDTHKSSG